ncbi:non-specific lipid transfer protein GPI-anchored 5 [Syzygium oleosum]|uniref:non-specific lipid transfer protein GPI-anchored 5 n=1 Tax=Syzygium oleosum TaxID=219896 RepID=UPI0011D1DB81|nr:non-specific lipid transfer protein GPI-anchored 5 [Syzygium oleosum]
MADRRMEAALVLATVAMLWVRVAAQSSCTNVLISLSPCLNYITGNSSTPSSNCCTQLASVVRSQPQCLCQVLTGGGSSLGINVNQTQALALPGACNVQTPPISSCNATSPAESPSETPESPTAVPSGNGSKTIPSTQEDGSSDAGSIKLSIPLLLVLLLTGSYVSMLSSH